MSDAPSPIAVLVDREGLGDVMLKTPFLRALRRAFPEHEVWWIATHQTSMADELRALFASDVARVIPHAGLDGPPAVLMERLRALPRFARVFDSRTKVSTVALTRLALKHRGFYCCLPGYVLCDGQAPGRRRPRHIAERMLSLVGCATGAAPRSEGRLEASAQAKAAALADLPDGARYVGLAPGSRQAEKNWPMARFCELAARLAAEGLTPVIFLGPMEGAVDEDLRARLPAAHVLRADPDQSPSAALDHLIAQAQRLSLLIANDNGVGHLMGAAGTPVLSLFGPTDPRRWAPVAPRNQVLRSQDFGGDGDMAAIPTPAVAAAAVSMLASVPPFEALA
jgi:ADP-heptose:LPS heptosyltransferase